MTAEPVPVDAAAVSRTARPEALKSTRRHTHDWRLRAVSHEDARAVEEYRCVGCGDITFR